MRQLDPNSKSNKFFDEEEFLLEVEMAREWFEGDNNLEIILYKVDKNSMPVDDLYNEVRIDQVRYLDPITISVYPSFDESTNKAYSQTNGSLKYKEDGDFSFIVYEEALKELRTDILYGDFIGYRVNESTIRYFEVIDDDKTNFGNNRTLVGYRSYYRIIKCKPITNDKFRGA